MLALIELPRLNHSLFTLEGILMEPLQDRDAHDSTSPKTPTCLSCLVILSPKSRKKGKPAGRTPSDSALIFGY